MNSLVVIPAHAGTHLGFRSTRGSGTSWVPAFAGMTLWVAMLFLLLFATPAAAQNFPPLTSRVVDEANLLRPEQKVDLDSKLSALEAQSGRQFVVATVNSLDGQDISDYTYQLGRHWKIGDEKRDDGAVMVVAPNERKVWIASGYGAGAYLTDSVTGRIVREAILPRFKAGDMGGGIIAGAERVIEVMKLPPEEAARQAQASAAAEKKRGRSSGGAGFIPVVFIVIIFFMVIGGISRAGGGRRYRGRGSRGGIDPLVVLWGLEALSRASRGRGGWGGGGGFGGGGFGGGGGFSGGGGSFGGGGAGGSW